MDDEIERKFQFYGLFKIKKNSNENNMDQI
jgi:hypothetical protein